MTGQPGQPRAPRRKRRTPKPRLPHGPDDTTKAWQPPGIRKDIPPQPVSRAIRSDARQIGLPFEPDDEI
jgi:hypothetical protein